MTENLITVFQTSPWLFYTTVLLTGLCVGSFLNVVAYRLPLMMEREWKHDCQEFLQLKPDNSRKELSKFNLAIPGSACPNCGHQLRAWENIPVLSYIFLKAKCSSCKIHISAQYPVIEALTGVVSIIVAIRFGVSLQTLAALFFSWTLITLTLIDIKTQLLPDNITLPLLWAGICLSFFNVFTDLQASVMGAIAGYMVLWVVYQLFKIITRKEGMGFGDFKLLAALGAWTGINDIPQIILLSSVVGSVVGISMLALGKTKSQQTIPFGPYLAIAGWIALLWGEIISEKYLSFL